MNIKVIQLTFVNTAGYTQSLLIRKGEKSYGFVPYEFPDVWMVFISYLSNLSGFSNVFQKETQTP